jgi:hypothetical protein
MLQYDTIFLCAERIEMKGLKVMRHWPCNLDVAFSDWSLVGVLKDQMRGLYCWVSPESLHLRTAETGFYGKGNLQTFRTVGEVHRSRFGFCREVNEVSRFDWHALLSYS